MIGVVFYLHQDAKADVRELRSPLHSVLQGGVKLAVAVKHVVQAAFDEGQLESSSHAVAVATLARQARLDGRLPMRTQQRTSP